MVSTHGTVTIRCDNVVCAAPRGRARPVEMNRPGESIADMVARLRALGWRFEARDLAWCPACTEAQGLA
jgi:hypothetical protein